MKKINFLLLQLKTGGGVRVITELANKAVEYGYDVSIIYPNIKKENISFFINKRINLEKIGKSQFKILNFLKFFIELRKKKNEIIITTDPIISIFTRFFPKKCKKIRFCQIDDFKVFDDLRVLRSRVILFFYKLLTKFSYRDKNIRYVFNSKIVYQEFLKNSKRNDIPLKLIHPSVDGKIFYNKKVRKTDEINIGIVGRKNPWKGLKEILKALDLLDKNIKEKINKVYVISHDDLSEFKLKERENFELIIPKNDIDIAEIYNKCHIFISASWFEGFGLPPLEAMKCGCAVITSRSKGVDEFAIDEENCLMFQPKNVNQLKEKLEYLILNSQKRRELQNSYLKLKKEFSTENMYKQLELILLENE